MIEKIDAGSLQQLRRGILGRLKVYSVPQGSAKWFSQRSMESAATRFVDVFSSPIPENWDANFENV